MMSFYFYVVCFTFSISCSVLPVYVFQSLHLFFFCMCFLKPLSSIAEKLLYTYVNNIYIRKLVNFCLTKKFMTF